MRIFLFFFRYERLLRRARTEDLSEISGIGCLYQSGVDRLGRPVVVFCGKWFPASNVNLDKVGRNNTVNNFISLFVHFVVAFDSSFEGLYFSVSSLAAKKEKSTARYTLYPQQFMNNAETEKIGDQLYMTI